ncbi:MAG: RcnB family protein [Brevundimonas sp.]|uniref:RcnB family protein n=1 Tax=Brevundimonas sp. TaxID=1871086 RepID=UPI00391A77FE
MRHWLMMAAAAGVFCLPAMAAAPVLAQDAGDPELQMQRETRHEGPTERREARQERLENRQERREERQERREERRETGQERREERQENRQDFRQDRREERREFRNDPTPDRREDRQDFRQDRREDWQERREDRRDDRRDDRWDRRDDRRDERWDRRDDRRDYRQDRHEDRREYRRDRRDYREFQRSWNRDRWRSDWSRRHRDNWWRSHSWFRDYSGVRVGFYFAPGYGYYQVPRHYWGVRWSAGQYLPSVFWRYRLNDWSWDGLPWPPVGTRWVYVDNHAYLIDERDGYILDVIWDVWRW